MNKNLTTSANYLAYSALITIMPGDALDHLLDQDVFRDVDTNMDIPVRRKASPTSRAQDSAFGLGIDEEIKISKRRRPIAKLDEDRYGSAP